MRGIDVGYPVMARVSNGLGGFAIANHNIVVPIPSSLTFTRAVCLGSFGGIPLIFWGHSFGQFIGVIKWIFY